MIAQALELPVLVHAGFPRTATSAMQAELAGQDSDALFLGRGPTLRRDCDMWCCSEIDRVMRSIRDARPVPEPEIDALHDVIREACARLGKRWLIVSDERICKPPLNRAAEWRSLQAAALVRVFGRPHVLLTTRRQDELLCSLYRLAARKSGETLPDFTAWLNSGGGSDYAPWTERLDFLSYYTAMADAVGAERVHVLPYEAYRRDPTVIDRMLQRVMPMTSCRVALRLRLAHTRERGGALRHWWRLARHSVGLCPEPPRRVTVPRREAALAAAYFAESNRELARRAGVALPGYDRQALSVRR